MPPTPAKPKPKLFRVFMVNPEGDGNRTIELLAKDKDAARRLCERQADDVAEQFGGEPYVVKTITEI